ncbi:MAG: nitronate monooxygenase [Defluviitaleaceae bacterium]|nr:nitronate monooxygenase [Defluviitaleaceae bacterium]
MKPIETIKTLKQLDINGLIAKLPIIQGGMGVGVSMSRLAGTVASEGGVGVISAAQPGFNWDGFSSNPLKANLEALAYHILRAKERAKDGLIGVNIMCAINHYAEYVKCAIENKADLIISGAGLPTKLPELVKDSAIKIAPIVSSKKAAAVLLKMWDKKFGKTADMVVIEGPKAGGHLGFSAEDLSKQLDYDNEVLDILQEVSHYSERYNRVIPTVFAGGVSDNADVQHYMGLGCAGVQVATKFVATEECDVADEYKQAYISATDADVTIVKSPVGMPGRAISNEFIKGLLTTNRKITECSNCISTCNPKTIPYCITKALINAAIGKTNEGLIFCGAYVGRIKEISTVKRVIAELLPA